MNERVDGMSMHEYRQVDAVSSTDLRNARTSLKKYKAHRERQPAPTAAMMFGTAAHCAVLTPELFRDSYVAAPGAKRGKKYDEFLDANPGKNILTADEMARCLNAATAVHHHPAAAPYLRHGEAEISLFWEEHGVKAKCRPDWLNGAYVEFKTASRIDPRSFANQSYTMGYHLQYAWYRSGIRAVLDRDVPVVVIAAETQPPFDVVVYTVDDIVLEEGRHEYTEALAAIAKGEREKRFPGISDEPLSLMIPNWAYVEQDNFTLSIDGEEVRP